MKFNPKAYEQILFDMDGVITSEAIYWDAAALTVYELLFDYRFYGRQEIDRAWCRQHVKELSAIILDHGKTIRAVKKLGVNTNWDLAYLVFAASKYIDPEPAYFEPGHFEAVRMFIENMTALAPELYDLVGGLLAAVQKGHGEEFWRRGGDGLWKQLHGCFQRWLHGDDSLEGLNAMEQPLLTLAELRKTLSALQEAGPVLGIGTGRNRDEILYPLQMWKIEGYFSPTHIATYDEVLAAEHALGSRRTLAKPDPFVFLKAAFGAQYTDQQLAEGAYDKEACKRILVVGDAPSDLLSAQRAGFAFAAVLTGIEGKDARLYFEEQKADYIFDSVKEMVEPYGDTAADTPDA